MTRPSRDKHPPAGRELCQEVRQQNVDCTQARTPSGCGGGHPRLGLPPALLGASTHGVMDTPSKLPSSAPRAHPLRPLTQAPPLPLPPHLARHPVLAAQARAQPCARGAACRPQQGGGGGGRHAGGPVGGTAPMCTRVADELWQVVVQDAASGLRGARSVAQHKSVQDAATGLRHAAQPNRGHPVAWLCGE